MKFLNEDYELDLGSTTIDNLFLKAFLFEANEASLKVFLYLTMLSQKSARADIEDFQKELGLKKDEVEEAFRYWKSMNIIEEIISPDYSVSGYRIKKFKNMYLQRDQLSEKRRREIEKNKKANEKYKEDLKNNKNIFDEIESITGYMLKQKEIEQICQFLKDTNVDPDIIIRATRYAVNERGINNTNYILAVCENWVRQGVKKANELKEEHFLINRKRNYVKKKTKKNLETEIVENDGKIKFRNEFERRYYEKYIKSRDE